MGKKIFLVLIIIILLGGVGGFFAYRHLQKPTSRSAVFMTNGQVYFGYIKSTDSENVKLQDVYYLKTNDLQSTTSNANKKIMLVKMGNELHGPLNSMSINRDQVLYWQTLSDNSKINDAIKRFNSQTAQN